jgi:hypothetical protein
MGKRWKAFKRDGADLLEGLGLWIVCGIAIIGALSAIAIALGLFFRLLLIAAGLA